MSVFVLMGYLSVLLIPSKNKGINLVLNREYKFLSYLQAVTIKQSRKRIDFDNQPHISYIASPDKCFISMI